MDDKGYGHIPNALFDAITFLAQALPKRSVPTWLERVDRALYRAKACGRNQMWVALETVGVSQGA